MRFKDDKPYTERVFSLKSKHAGKKFHDYYELKFIQPSDVLVSEKTKSHLQQIFASKLLRAVSKKERMSKIVNQPIFIERIVEELKNQVVNGTIVSIDLATGSMSPNDSLILVNTEFDFNHIIDGFNRQTDITIECRYLSEKKKLMLKTVKQTFRV